MRPETFITGLLTIAIAAVAALVGCQTTQPVDSYSQTVVVHPPAIVAVAPSPTPVPAVPILTWEIDRPERRAWTEELYNLIDANFEKLDRAKDTKDFCPKYDQLSRGQKIKVFMVIMEWDALYESSWNPKSESVDVGTAGNKNSWSVGLWQMSQTDQANYGIKLGYSYEDLKDPIKNARLAIPILADLVAKYGYIARKPGGGSYWSTLRPTTKAPAIQKKTKDLDICKAA
jgi:hypothetical protein